MNSKMIAIIAVIAMCGAALVGVGYAYQASYSTGNNTADANVDYVTLDVKNNDALVSTFTLKGEVLYNTVKTSASTEYDPYDVVASSTGGLLTYDLVLSATNVGSEAKGNFDVTMTVTATGTLPNGAMITLNGQKITFTDGSYSNKVLTDVAVTGITGTYTVGLAHDDAAESLTTPPTDVEVTIKVTFVAAPHSA